MLKLGGVVSALKCTTEGISNACMNPLRSNVLTNGFLGTGNLVLKPCGVNLIQTRHKRVVDDAMEPHRVFRHDKITGARTSSEIVLKKFFRLRWGGWIRTIRGRDEEVWRKNSDYQRMFRKHVFCNAKQSSMLDKMVTEEYKRPHYYVDDPYEPYHSREEYLLTRHKPLPPSKNVYQFIDD